MADMQAKTLLTIDSKCVTAIKDIWREGLDLVSAIIEQHHALDDKVDDCAERQSYLKARNTIETCMDRINSSEQLPGIEESYKTLRKAPGAYFVEVTTPEKGSTIASEVVK